MGLLVLAGFLMFLLIEILKILFGGKIDDPFQWPEVASTVSSYRAEAKFRGNRIDVTPGPDVEKVNVYVTVQLPDGHQAEVLPAALSSMAVNQPSSMDFHTFMREVDTLAIAQAKQILPPGSQIVIRADPERRGHTDKEGRRWTRAWDQRTALPKPATIAILLFFLTVGTWTLIVKVGEFTASLSP